MDMVPPVWKCWKTVWESVIDSTVMNPPAMSMSAVRWSLTWLHSSHVIFVFSSSVLCLYCVSDNLLFPSSSYCLLTDLSPVPQTDFIAVCMSRSSASSFSFLIYFNSVSLCHFTHLFCISLFLLACLSHRAVFSFESYPLLSSNAAFLFSVTHIPSFSLFVFLSFPPFFLLLFSPPAQVQMVPVWPWKAKTLTSGNPHSRSHTHAHALTHTHTHTHTFTYLHVDNKLYKNMHT